MFELSTSEAFVFAITAILAGMYLLIKGGDWTVDSAVYIADRFGVSPMLVGFTIVAMGTSLPELVVSLFANIQGLGGIAIGNVIGSNIANILFVVGLTAVVVPLITNSKAIFKDLVMMLVASIIMLALMMDGDVERVPAIGMVILLIGYIFMQYKMNKQDELAEESDEDFSDDEIPSFKNDYLPYVFLLLGLVCIAVGADFLVRGAKTGALILGVPDAVVALSVIALGTSLPELSTCIIAARRGHSGIVVGNILGSNVFNILMIIGVTAIIKPIREGTYAPQLANLDVWVMMAVSVIFALVLLLYKKVDRPVGVSFVMAYVLYNAYIYAIYYIQ